MRIAVDVSERTYEQRRALTQFILRDPHPYTVDDLQFSLIEFGHDRDEVERIFLEAPVLVMVPHPRDSARPLYIVCIDTHGYVHTLSHSDLGRYKRHMTVCLARFMREGGGHELAQGAMGWADRADLDNGSVDEMWARTLGFEPHDSYQHHGHEFVRFRYSGANAL